MYWNKYSITDKDHNPDRVLKVLKYYKGKEVNAWKLCYDSKVLHYTQAVMELRRKWYIIENRTEYKGKIQHSFYKLLDNETWKPKSI